MIKNLIANLGKESVTPNNPHLISYLSSYTRILTLKDCLPELSRKIYYDWKREGLIPATFGVPKELSTSLQSDQYRKWDRFHLYEFIWIRLVYHLRVMGLPKEYMQKMAILFFPEMDARLLNKITKNFQSRSKQLRDTTKKLTSIVGTKGATHETDKVFSTIAESLAMSTFHEIIFNGLSNRKAFDVIAANGIIQISDASPLIKNNSAIPDMRVAVPHVVIPFTPIINDIVINIEISQLKDILNLSIGEVEVIESLKNQVKIEKHHPVQPISELDELSKEEMQKQISRATKYTGFLMSFFFKPDENPFTRSNDFFNQANS